MVYVLRRCLAAEDNDGDPVAMEALIAGMEDLGGPRPRRRLPRPFQAPECQDFCSARHPAFLPLIGAGHSRLELKAQCGDLRTSRPGDVEYSLLVACNSVGLRRSGDGADTVEAAR